MVIAIIIYTATHDTTANVDSVLTKGCLEAFIYDKYFQCSILCIYCINWNQICISVDVHKNCTLYLWRI